MKTAIKTIEKANGLTVQKLNDFCDFNSVSQTLDYARSFNIEYPSTPTKPFLAKGHSSVEAKQYVIDLEKYEIEKESCQKDKDEYNKVSSEIGHLMEEFIRERSGLNSIPEQYRDKVYSNAYQSGHSSGMSQVFNDLLDLVEIFN